MNTIVVLIAIMFPGQAESYTYSFQLPANCEPGAYMAVQAQEDYMALLMECFRGSDGKGRWRPAPKGPTRAVPPPPIEREA